MERDLASQAAPRRRGGLPSGYVAGWVVLSSMALSYLAMVAARPDLAEGLGRNVASLVGIETTSGGEDARTEQALAELAALRQELERAQREIGSMRSLVAAREEREQALTSRLAAIEAQHVAEQSSPVATSSVARRSSEPAEEPATPARIAVEGPLSEPPERAARASDAKRLAFGPAQIKPTHQASEPEELRGIQIATGPSVDALRISWMLLAERHKGVLKRLEPRFVPSTTGNGPAYRLIAGPMESTAAANRACSELRARRVTCGVAPYGGEPL